MGEFQIQEVELISCQPRHPTCQQRHRHRHRHRQRQHRQRHAPTARAASGVDTACGQALGSTSVSPGPTEMRTRPARRSPSQLLACSSNGGSGGGSERVGVGGGGGQCRGRGEKGSRLLAQSRASSSGTSGVQQRCAVASVLAKAYGLATECAAPLLACLPLLLHSSKAARLAGVGGAARKTFLPLITWYHTASSTEAVQKQYSSNTAAVYHQRCNVVAQHPVDACIIAQLTCAAAHVDMPVRVRPRRACSSNSSSQSQQQGMLGRAYYECRAVTWHTNCNHQQCSTQCSGRATHPAAHTAASPGAAPRERGCRLHPGQQRHPRCRCPRLATRQTPDPAAAPRREGPQSPAEGGREGGREGERHWHPHRPRQ